MKISFPICMRIHTSVAAAIVLFLCAPSALPQAPPADSKPSIQSDVGFTMPQVAIDAEIGGTVMVGVRVEETGKVSKVWIVAGPMWPCGKMPLKAIDKLSDTLSDTIKTMKFTPAIRNGKAVDENVALTLKLVNPNLVPGDVKMDPVTGKPIHKFVSQGVVNGKALSLPKPAYPAAARENRDGGTVSVQILIDEEGKVIRAGAINGAPTLQYAARDAACEAKFSRTTLEGKAVKVSGVVTYNFVPGPQR